MKVYFYMVISLGIMLMLGIAGITTTSNELFRMIVNNNNTIIQPDTGYNDSTIGTIGALQSGISSQGYSFWTKIFMTLAAISGLTLLVGVVASFTGFNVDVKTLAVSVLSIYLLALITKDMWGLVTLMFGYGIDFLSYFMLTIISVFLIGFAISIIEFLGGTD